MNLNRTTILSSLNVNVPNEYNGVGAPLAVNLMSIQVITDEAGNRVGHPQQQQQLAIRSDFDDNVIAAINQQLAYLGLALMPIDQAITTE